MPALAANCKSSGGLTYLGNTRDQSKSVWLSRTDQGSFGLESAKGSQFVDSWAVPPQRRLHISTSPEVSSGNGGTHKLYDTSDNKPCLIDTQNQKRDWNIPPNIQLPNLQLPDNTLPPIGNLFPDFGRPTLPGGVQPPIATLPPGTLTPTVPGRPPTGIMPTLPGGVQPPIATLPPGTLTPTVPGRPPTGIMPTLPGGVQPPIGTLPPGTLTPTVPGRPPTGIMPTLPGGYSLRSGHSRLAASPRAFPVGCRRRSPRCRPGAVTPGTPGVVQRPGVTVPPIGQGVLARTARPGVDCIDPRSQTSGVPDKPICPPEILAAAAQRGEVPLTEGRDLGPPTLWNFWVQPLGVVVSDQRYGLDMDTELGSVTMGLDRRLGDNVVLGASLTLQNSRTDGFDDLLQAESTGFTIGPYVAVRLSPAWAIDASLTYGQYDNDLTLSVLEGSYQSRQWSGNITAHGQYTLGEYFLRPKASITYSHVESDEYDLQGNVLGFPIDVSFPEDSFNYGVIDLSTEFSRIFTFESGTSIMPYAEIGATYEFERPNGGQILTADLALVTPSEWAGTLRAGATMLLNESVQVDASAGYLSFGQDDLNIWEGKLQVSFGF